MKKKSFPIRTLFITGLVSVASISSCSKKPNTDLSAAEVKFRVEEAPEWTALFNRSQGWFGGDGIFAIPFSGKDHEAASDKDSILFVFSDTMVGEIKAGTLAPGWKMINNSSMVLKGKDPSNATFKVNRNEKGEARTLFIPKSPEEPKDYFWLGDGFVNVAGNKNLYLFAYQIRNTHNKEDFPFREVGNTLLSIPPNSKYPFEDHRQLELPFSPYEPGHTSFGVGVLDNTAASGVPSPDDFVYVYGVRKENKELVAARMKPDAIEDFSAWQFWNGKDWSEKFKESAPIADSVSNELSVTPIGENQYALVYQYKGILPIIYMQVGPTPVGPFGPRMKVWETTKNLEDQTLFTYNAKAHPAISKPGELLVSYNVNSYNFLEDIKRIPNLYRPRFVRVIFEKE